MADIVLHYSGPHDSGLFLLCEVLVMYNLQEENLPLLVVKEGGCRFFGKIGSLLLH